MKWAIFQNIHGEKSLQTLNHVHCR